MSMSEYTPRRLKSAKIKADQMAATGAKIVATSCHNCVDGLTDVIRHYKLGMQVTQLVNLVANALVYEVKVAVPEKIEKAIPAPSLEGYRILVVDDEPDTLVYLTTVLEDNGAVTFSALSGEEAIETARKEKPDLITLDLSMPGKDGGVIFKELRSDPELAGIKVCIVTGKPELRGLIYDRHISPPDGFLDKPISEESLLLNTRKILELPHHEP